VYTPYRGSFLSVADGHFSWCLPCFGRLVSISNLRRLTQGHIPLGGDNGDDWPTYTFHDSIDIRMLLYGVLMLQRKRFNQVWLELPKLLGRCISHNRFPTTIDVTVNYIQELQRTIGLHGSAARAQTSLTLTTQNRRNCLDRMKHTRVACSYHAVPQQFLLPATRSH
jgi:hypothetical protein